MSTEEFDKIIKNNLQDYEADLSHMDWGDFKDTMPSDIESDSFDSDIKDLLSGYKTTYKQDHWDILRDHIVHTKLIRKHIFEMKGMELIIAVFFLFLFSSVFNFNSVDIYEAKSGAMANVIHPSELNQNSDHLNSSISIADIIIKKGVQNSSVSTSQTKKSKSEVSEIVPAIGIKNNRRLFSSHQNEVTILKSGIELPKHKLISVDHINVRPILPLHKNFIDSPSISVKEKTKTSFKIATGPRRNIISSPFDPVYRTVGYISYMTGMQASATIHKKWEKIGFYTGLRYMNIKYNPVKVAEIYDVGRQDNVQYSQSLSENKFHNISIPLGLEYTLLNKGKHAFYATMSGDFNVVLSSDYSVEIHKAGGSHEPELERSSPISQTQLATKSFISGITEGGYLSDNFYLSASAGIGYKYKLTDNLHLTSETIFQRSIITNGLGPNNDKFHGISLELGIKLAL